MQSIIAGRTFLWENNWLLLPSAPLRQRPDHFRDDIARPPHQHRVADHQPLALDFILIVQGRTTHDDPADIHRLQHCHWRDRSCPPDLIFHPAHHRLGLFRRKLPRHSPARGTGRAAQLLLHGKAGGLDDHAVNLVVQPVADLLKMAVVLLGLGQTAAEFDQRIDREAERTQMRKQLG